MKNDQAKKFVELAQAAQARLCSLGDGTQPVLGWEEGQALVEMLEAAAALVAAATPCRFIRGEDHEAPGFFADALLELVQGG